MTLDEVVLENIKFLANIRNHTKDITQKYELDDTLSKYINEEPKILPEQKQTYIKIYYKQIKR